jgi:hypothetical protein
MTQAQRKKAAEEAKGRLALADAALAAATDARSEAFTCVLDAEREVRKNEPLTKAQKECLLRMAGGMSLESYRSRATWKESYSLRGDGSSLSVSKSAYAGLRDREMLGGLIKVDDWSRKHQLSDWGREVAEKLLKGGKD